MAHTKSGGSTSLGRDSVAKRLGVKRTDSERVRPGMVLVRQRGTKHRIGQNVARGSDDTLFALTEGIVRFRRRKIKSFTGKLRERVFVDVVTP